MEGYSGRIAVAAIIHIHPDSALAYTVVAGHQVVVGIHSVIARGDGGRGSLHGIAVLIHIIYGHRYRDRHGRGRGGHIRLRGNIQADDAHRLIVCIKTGDFQIFAAQVCRIGKHQLRQRRTACRRKRRVLRVRVADFQRSVGGQRIGRHIQPVAAFIAGLGYFAGQRLHGRFAFHPGKGKYEGRLHFACQRGERHMAQHQQNGQQKAADPAQREGRIRHNGASFGASSEDTKIMFQLYYEIVLSSMNRAC